MGNRFKKALRSPAPPKSNTARRRAFADMMMSEMLGPGSCRECGGQRESVDFSSPEVQAELADEKSGNWLSELSSEEITAIRCTKCGAISFATSPEFGGALA